MRRISPLAVSRAFAVALLATAPAADATLADEKIVIVYETMEVEARVLSPADFLAQARAGTLRRCELEVGPGALREALARAHKSAALIELAIQPKKAEPLRYELENVRITSYQIGGAGADARVVLQIQRVVSRAQGGPKSGVGGITTAPGGVPDRPDPGGPDQGAMALSLQPDLRIRLARQKVGDPNTLEVEVYNHGPGPAGATAVKVLFKKKNNPVQTSSGPVPALASGQIAWVAVALPLPFPAADHLAARVDDPNKVPETNELNNGFVVVP